MKLSGILEKANVLHQRVSVLSEKRNERMAVDARGRNTQQGKGEGVGFLFYLCLKPVPSFGSRPRCGCDAKT